MKNYDDAEDVVEFIMDLEYPTKDFEMKYAPKDLSEDEQKIPTKIKIWELNLKSFLGREEELLKNILKLYGLIFG